MRKRFTKRSLPYGINPAGAHDDEYPNSMYAIATMVDEGVAHRWSPFNVNSRARIDA